MFGSSRAEVPDPGDRKPLHEYMGEEQYVGWIRDYLGVELTEPQKEMIQAFKENQKTLVVAGNGFGKTYCLSALSLAFLFTNYPAVVLATSGTYSKMRRTYCQPVKEFHNNTWGLPGKYLETGTRIKIPGEPNVFWEASSPGDPGELEGVHSKYTMAIVEEADKQAVTEAHFDSMSSLITDERDKLMAVANPPEDESDVVNQLMDDETWTTLEFSSFDSYNVRKEMSHPDPYQKDADGEVLTDKQGHPKLKESVASEMVDGIVRLNQIRRDWESWNRESWPGTEAAMNSADRDDLDVRWYRRRLGTKPPELAVVHRPYTVEDVKKAWSREPAMVTATPDGLGLDIARGTGDYNALVGVFGREIRVLDYWHLDKHETHVDSENHVRDLIQPSWDCRLAVDAVGEGSGIADMIMSWYPNVYRFQNGANAIQDEKYRDKWTESNAIFGQLLRDGSTFTENRLREEVLAASRTLEFSESFRRSRGAEVLDLNSKGDIKSRLGRSPDLLDAALMAAWAASEETYSGPKTIPSTW